MFNIYSRTLFWTEHKKCILHSYYLITLFWFIKTLAIFSSRPLKELCLIIYNNLIMYIFRIPTLFISLNADFMGLQWTTLLAASWWSASEIALFSKILLYSFILFSTEVNGRPHTFYISILQKSAPVSSLKRWRCKRVTRQKLDCRTSFGIGLCPVRNKYRR